MDFTKFIKEMDIISLLDDAPNDVGGLNANELKAKFDEGGKAIRDFINNVLLVELKKYTDEAPSPKDLEDIYDAIHEVVLGQIPDGTITEQKIADGAVSEKKLAPGTLDGAMPKVSMNAPTAADNIAAGYPVGKTWLRPNYTLTNLAYNKTAEEFVATACAASKAGQTFTIAGNGDDKAISADLNHGSANGWLYCVVTPDATAASASMVIGGETVALTVGEANTIQRRYTGESIKFEATYATANAAASGKITVVNLTLIDEAATLGQVDESCRDVSDNTVFGFVLGNLPLDTLTVRGDYWMHKKDGEWHGGFYTENEIEPYLFRIAFGSYTGNNSSSRIIELPFTPDVVFVASQTGAMEYYRSAELRYGGIAVRSKNAAAVSITTNGFTVYNNQASNSVWNYTNKSSTVYIYFAIYQGR